MSYPPPTLRGMWNKWYHVLVEEAGGRRYLIAIEATSALEARLLVEADWGETRVIQVKSAR